MGSQGSIWADAGLKINNGDFANYAAKLKTAEGQIGEFSSVSQGVLAGAFTLPAAAVTGAAAYGASIAASYEDANLTLKTLYGSQEAAQEKFQWLQQFAATTPFEFPELLDAATQLKAYGMDVETYGRTLGDTAAAMGKPIDMAVQALADAQQGEFERMKEFGVKAVEITKKNYQQLGAASQDAGKTALTYMDNNGKQQIAVVDRNNKEMVTSTIAAIWNSRYAGAMEERSRSFTGLISTIKDNLKAGLGDMAGFDMKTASIEGGSLLSILKELAGVAIVLSGSFANMSEPMQTFVIVGAVGGAAALALAGGLIAANAAGITTAGVMGALSLAVNSVIWPATLIVGTLALVGAGLVYLNEKTGVVTYAWTLFKDLFTITVNGIMTAAGILRDFIVGMMDEIKTAISNFIPEGFITGVSNAVGGIINQFSRMGINIHAQAESIRGDTAEVGTTTEQTGSVVQDVTTQMMTGFTGAGQSAQTMGSNVAGASTGLNTLTTSMQTSSSQAATFVGYLNSVSTGLLNARANATNAAMAMQAAGSSMEQAQKAYHAYMQGTLKENQPGVTNSGKGTGTVKLISAKTNGSATKTASDAVSSSNSRLNNWSTQVNVGTINNYANSNASKTKLSVLSKG